MHISITFPYINLHLKTEPLRHPAGFPVRPVLPVGQPVIVPREGAGSRQAGNGYKASDCGHAGGPTPRAWSRAAGVDAMDVFVAKDKQPFHGEGHENPVEHRECQRTKLRRTTGKSNPLPIASVHMPL